MTPSPQSALSSLAKETAYHPRHPYIMKVVDQTIIQIINNKLDQHTLDQFRTLQPICEVLPASRIAFDNAYHQLVSFKNEN